MKKTVRILSFILITFACGMTCVAGTITETGDAGSTLATAQIIAGGANPLTAISGTLSAGNDADIYQLYIPVGSAFSASTVGTTTIDTQLFLLSASGFGIYANDDAGPLQSTLPGGHPFSPTTTGIYYLVISSFNNDPSNSSGILFPDDWGGVHGPSGPGGALAFGSMTGGNGDTDSYTINLTGAEFVTATPEPGTFLALGGGMLALVLLRRRRFSI